MILIFGTRSKPTVLGQLPHVCRGCGQHAYHTYVRWTDWFTLFFIPVFPIGKNTQVHCNACGFWQHVPNDQADQLFSTAMPSQSPYRGG